jgi:TonB family protein
MRRYILLLPLILSIHAQAQDVKKQTYGSEWYEEEYYVLKSNKNVRHGLYKNYKTQEINIQGQFENGKRIGQWNFYEKGTLVYTYNYSTQLTELNKPIKTNYEVLLNNSFTKMNLISPPTYLGGKPGLELAINRSISYPRQARMIGLEGLVIVSVVVDQNGTAKEIKIESGPQEFHDELVSAFEKIDQYWISGSTDTTSFTCKLYYTFEFRLRICGGLGCSTIFIN